MGEQYKKIKDGEFRVVLNAKMIQRSAFRIISNEKYVPKRMRWLGADEVGLVAKEFKRHVLLANNIKLDSPQSKDDRRKEQEMAVAYLKTLSQLMDDLCDDIGFSRDHIQQWHSDVNNELALLSKWIASDKRG